MLAPWSRVMSQCRVSLATLLQFTSHFTPVTRSSLLLTPCHRYITGHGCSCVLGSHTLLPDRVIHINGLTNEQPAEWEEALNSPEPLILSKEPVLWFPLRMFFNSVSRWSFSSVFSICAPRGLSLLADLDPGLGGTWARKVVSKEVSKVVLRVM